MLPLEPFQQFGIVVQQLNDGIADVHDVALLDKPPADSAIEGLSDWPGRRSPGVAALTYHACEKCTGHPTAADAHMSTLLVSSKGQIVLPAALRRRLGMGAGARIEVLEEPDGLKLRVVRPVATADLTGMAGMVKAPARGVPRRLEDFDPASLLKRSRLVKP